MSVPSRQPRGASLLVESQLLGRSAEEARIRDLLEAVRSGVSGTLLVTGEPGVGKTALLRHASDLAHDLTVLSARGTEAESKMPFSGLSDLLRPLVPLLGRVPVEQRRALSNALGLGEAALGDPFSAHAATLSLLATAAELSPVLGIVDDVQWLDPASWDVLGFVARRLGSEGVLLLFAGRDEASASAGAAIPRLKLDGLNREASVALIARTDGAVTPAVAQRLFDLSLGNPLAMIELTSALSDEQRAGIAPLAAVPRLGPVLEGALLERLARLPDVTRRALIVLSAAGPEEYEVVASAMEALQITRESLDAAVEAGVVVVENGRTEFRHPLLRSVVYHAAHPDERRDAHRMLAGALGGGVILDKQAWHLASATENPDERVATLLDEVAARALRRGAYASAAQAEEWAARLSTSDVGRARRLLGAALASRPVGHYERAAALLDEALTFAQEPLLRADIDRARGEVEMWRGPVMAGHRILTAAAGQVGRLDPGREAVLLAESLIASLLASEFGVSRRTAERVLAMAAADDGAKALASAALAIARTCEGDPRGATALLNQALRWSSGLSPPENLRAVFYVAFGHVLLEDFDGARQLLAPAIAEGRSASALALLPFPLFAQSNLDFLTGAWAEAYAVAVEGIRLGEETGQPSAATFARAGLAHLEAALGHEQASRARAARARQEAERAGVASIVIVTDSAMGFLELGLGRPEAAVPHLEAAERTARRQDLQLASFSRWMPDLIEAYLRMGRRQHAVDALERLEELAESGRRSELAGAARCRALLADEAGFASHFEESLLIYGEMPSPFEVARTQLNYGERLRRARRRVEARSHLRAALAHFERLGASPWANRTRAELEATGLTARSRTSPKSGLLTAQELQVALVVGKGTSNREAAAALFISPRTVEAHLASIYRKLNLRSRAQLAHLVASGAVPGIEEAGPENSSGSPTDSHSAALPT